jgi:hypothetical protein
MFSLENQLAAKLSLDLCPYFSPPTSLQHLFYEGFSPSEVAAELLNKNLLSIFDLILANHEGSSFQTEFVKSLKATIGELAFEISEGMKGGYNDFEVMLKENLALMVEKVVGRESAGLVNMFIMQNALVWVKKNYDEYVEAVILQILLIFLILT